MHRAIRSPGTWAVILNGILSETPPRPSSLAADIPPELDAIIGKALAKDREHRYGEAAEILGDLRQSGARHSVRACVRAATRRSLAVRVGPRGAHSIDRPPCGNSAGNSGLSGAVCRFRRSILNVRHYVWPEASVQDASTGEELSTDHVGQLLRRVVQEDRSAFVLLLGDYGSGKTSSCACGGMSLPSKLSAAARMS